MKVSINEDEHRDICNESEVLWEPGRFVIKERVIKGSITNAEGVTYP